MRPEYYADEYRRYQTYVRNFDGNEIYKIACGASDANYHWTDVLMQQAFGRRDRAMMHGLSLHYYTLGSAWNNKLPATGFGEDDWFAILRAALFMDELVTKHSEIMDRYDPDKQIGLLVDEWGTWYRPEPGSNPGFLVQQNSLRDALVAGVTLNIFNQHCDRVQMANIAQTINVLQAMAFTDGEKMALTPSYHVFDLYKVHHDATLLPSELACASYSLGDASLPALNASVSRSAGGPIHVTVCKPRPAAGDAADDRLAGDDAAPGSCPHADRSSDGCAQHLRPAGRGETCRPRRRDDSRRRGDGHAAGQVGDAAGD
jgi:alpha-N-arabinofuranosidase